MQASGLLPADIEQQQQQPQLAASLQPPAVMELGAGKGYLGLGLVQCAGVQRLVVADIKSNFKAKVRQASGACSIS